MSRADNTYKSKKKFIIMFSIKTTVSLAFKKTYIFVLEIA